MSDVPIDPFPHEDEDSGPDLDWLSDEPRPDAPADSALWPTPAQEMVSLPGFTLDDESVLVPLPPSSADDDGLADATSAGPEPAAGRPAGRRIRLSLTGARTGAAAGILCGVILTAGVISGGIGLPPPGDPDPAQEASAPAASPTVEIDDAWVARLDKTVKAAQTRERRQAAALERQEKRGAATRRERGARAPAPAETQQVSNPPATVHAAPADPWAGVPGAVREFEPGPWNNGGATS